MHGPPISIGRFGDVMAVSDVGLFLNTTGISDTERACAAVRELGFRMIQFGKLADHYYSPQGTRQLTTMLQELELRPVALCIVHDGESYSDLESVRQTVGFIQATTAA